MMKGQQEVRYAADDGVSVLDYPTTLIKLFGWTQV